VAGLRFVATENATFLGVTAAEVAVGEVALVLLVDVVRGKPIIFRMMVNILDIKYKFTFLKMLYFVPRGTNV